MRVELRSVTRRFGPVAALRDLTVTLPQGGRTALIGPNGAGKSTLTRVVMGMLACEGEVLVDGRSPFRERAQLAQRLAYVPQVAPPLGATVGDLVRAIAVLRGIDGARIAALAAELKLDLAAVRRRPVRHLSGGMRQKLLLALALASGAELLILDEPTASLDVDSRRRFFELVGELPGAPSILLCSHRLEEIRHLVDRVLELGDGALVYDGDATAYLQSCGRGVMEVRAESERAVEWLTARGFQRATARGWWTQSIHNGQRVELLSAMFSAVGTELTDVVVRDIERLDAGGDPR